MPAPGSAILPRHLIIAGMPRAGTTYLYHAFAAHPDAFVPYRKELRYFSINFHRGTDWYERFFSGAADRLRVDASPDYFMDPAAPARIQAYGPNVRVVLGVRDPADWAVSLHRQLATLERRVSSFDDFLRSAKYPDFGLTEARGETRLQFSLEAGFVRHQLAAFRSYLGSQLLLFDFTSFARNPVVVMATIESFLGLDGYFSHDNLPSGHINARSRKNRGVMSYLFSRDVVINAIGALTPRKALVALRLRIDRTKTASRDTARSEIDARDLASAKASLGEDTEYVRSLFVESPMILGDGAAYR